MTIIAGRSLLTIFNKLKILSTKHCECVFHYTNSQFSRYKYVIHIRI